MILDATAFVKAVVLTNHRFLLVFRCFKCEHEFSLVFLKEEWVCEWDYLRLSASIVLCS